MKTRRTLVAALTTLALCGACSRQEPPPEPAAPVKDILVELQEAVQRNPKDTDSWMHLADLYERGQAFEREADALQKVLAIEPGRSYAHLKLGNTYNRLERYQDAVASYLVARKTRPNDPVLYNNLAFAYGKIGKPTEQIAALRQAISLRPRYSTARLNLGIVLLNNGDRKGAEQQLVALREFDQGAAASLQRELAGGRRP
jgi:Flp pilus assembly protein TadD